MEVQKNFGENMSGFGSFIVTNKDEGSNSKSTVLQNFRNPCVWKCCNDPKHLRINRKYFWDCVIHMRKFDESYISSSLLSSSSSSSNDCRRLIYEKSIHLNTDPMVQSSICIGLDPENKFQVTARIQLLKSEEFLLLDAKEFRGLLDYMEFQRFNIMNQFPLKNSLATEKRFKIRICSIEPQKYTVTAHDHKIHMDFITLQRLCIIRDHMLRLKYSLQSHSDKSETAFLQLLSHFYYSSKSTAEACIQCDHAEKRASFFNDIIHHHCNCLDKEFIMEIALNCEIWFGLCVPYFVRTLMLHQSERLETFMLNWPSENNRISVEELSKSGFFDTGKMDNTMCAFCSVSRADWKEGDVPVIEHSKAQPTCPFLIDHTKTLNVDLDKKRKLDEIMLRLREKSM